MQRNIDALQDQAMNKQSATGKVAKVSSTSKKRGRGAEAATRTSKRAKVSKDASAADSVPDRDAGLAEDFTALNLDAHGKFKITWTGLH